MGYTTEFSGQISVEPPLSAEEVEFLYKFANTRRMKRKKGPYYVDGLGFKGQDREVDVLDQNVPPDGQPGLWCHWISTPDGKFVEWDGGEKFYNPAEWMAYLIEHFLKPSHLATMPFLGEHSLNGEILAQGEDITDRWLLKVENNTVSTEKLR